MDRLNFEGLEVELSEPQFLTVIDQIVKANHALAKMYFGLHASGFADWHGNFRPALETGAPAMAERLGPHIGDPELREAFYTLLEQTRSLVEIDDQIVAWLAEFAGLAAIRDKRGRTRLDRRLQRMASEGPEGPQGPVWATQPEYQALEEKSRQAMAAVTQAKEHFDQRLEQLLENAGGAESEGDSVHLAKNDVLPALFPPKGDILSIEEVQRLMMPYEPRESFPYLQMEVVTYADLWDRAEVVVGFIERVWRTFKPFQVKLEAMVWSRWKPRLSRPRIFGLKPTWKKWAETRRLLLEGEIARIVMYEWESTHSYSRGIEPDVYLGVHFGNPWEQARGHRMRRESMFDPREAKKFNLCINTRVWEGTVSAEVQEQTVSLACDLFQVVDGACGYVNIGNDSVMLEGPTPYERQLEMTESNTRRLWRDVRGAF